MKNLMAIALITLKEGLKSRVIFGILIIALLMFAASTILVTMFMRDIVKVAVDLGLSTVSFAGLLTILFIGVNLYAKDLDKRTIYMVISRPVSRCEYIIGKYLGIVMISILVVFVLGLFATLTVVAGRSYYSYPEARFNWAVFFTAVVYIFIKLTIISAVVTMFASFTSNSFITLALSLGVYIIGSATEGVKQIIEMNVERIDISPLLSNVITVAFYIFPNLALFDLKTQAAHGLNISPQYIIWTLIYSATYATMVVGIGALAFRRREFP